MTDHLAQLNIARMRAPLDDPIMSGFVDQLDHIESLQHYDYQSDHISPLRDYQSNTTTIISRDG